MASFYKSGKFVVFSLLVSLIIISFIVNRLSNSVSMSNVSSAQNFRAVPTKVPAFDPIEVHSPDGKMKVIMEKMRENAQSTFTFTVSDINGDNPKTILKKTLAENQNMFVSPNTFSPDNKYLFLKEEDSQSLSFFVFKTSGEPFSDGSNYIEVVPLFEKKKTGFQLSDITGWDSDTLLHVFTTSDKGRGPSYWFDLSGRNFLMLGSR